LKRGNSKKERKPNKPHRMSKIMMEEIIWKNRRGNRKKTRNSGDLKMMEKE